MVDFFAQAAAALESSDRPLSADELRRLTYQVGRNDAPVLLLLALRLGRADQAALTPLVGPAWSAAEYPDQALTRLEWHELFGVVGYTVDGVPADPPQPALVLWRGSVPERRTDWSWTTDRDVAVGYAAGTRARRPGGRLYRMTAPPGALLCANLRQRGESEYVVDTGHPGVLIEEAGG